MHGKRKQMSGWQLWKGHGDEYKRAHVHSLVYSMVSGLYIEFLKLYKLCI